jgi:hypothetical protein
MTINRYDLDAISKEAERRLLLGESKEAVYKTLSTDCDNAPYVAQCLASMPSLELRRRYRAWNAVLIGLLIYNVITSLLIFMGILVLTSKHPQMLYFLLSGLALLGIALSIVVVYGVSHYKIWGYVAVILFGALGINHALDRIFHHPTFSNFVDCISVIAVVVFAVILRKKLLPKAGIIGLKTDAKGQYQF